MKSIFIKNFATTALLLAFSFLLLAVSFVGIGRTYPIRRLPLPAAIRFPTGR